MITLFYYLAEPSNVGLLVLAGGIYLLFELSIGFTIFGQSISSSLEQATIPNVPSSFFHGLLSGLWKGLLPLTIDILGFLVILYNSSRVSDDKHGGGVTIVVLLYLGLRVSFLISVLYYKITLKWSEYQGYLDWEKASAKCKNINMRLPTISELKSAYNFGDTNTWLDDGHNYWTSEESSENEAYYFSVKNGTVHLAAKELDRHVRYLR